MDNMFEYLKWRSDLSFSKCRINEIDFALFSQIIMIPYTLYIDMPMSKTNDAITLKELAILVKENKEKIIKKMGLILPPQIVDIVIKMGESRRFENIVLKNYESEICDSKEIQFTVCTLDIDDETRVIVYSGTDDSIIGWKEDFNMMFTFPTPAQKEAIKYLKRYSEDKKIYIVGHSKGGNLAMYSTLHIREDIFEKIVKVYCFDAPGISEEIKNIDEAYKRFKKVVGYTPQTAIIGRLFKHLEKEIVVSSTSSGLYQHDLLSWEVEVNKFKRLDKRDEDSIHIEQKIDMMLEKMSPVLKEEFVEIGYGLFMRTQSQTLTDLANKKTQLIKQYISIKKEERKILEKTLSELLLDKVFIRNILYAIKETFGKTKEKKKYLKENETKK